MYGKIMILGGYLEQNVRFQWHLELLSFELCGQSYGPFTKAYAENIKTGRLFE